MSTELPSTSLMTSDCANTQSVQEWKSSSSTAVTYRTHQVTSITSKKQTTGNTRVVVTNTNVIPSNFSTDLTNFTVSLPENVLDQENETGLSHRQAQWHSPLLSKKLENCTVATLTESGNLEKRTIQTKAVQSSRSKIVTVQRKETVTKSSNDNLSLIHGIEKSLPTANMVVPEALISPPEETLSTPVHIIEEKKLNDVSSTPSKSYAHLSSEEAEMAAKIEAEENYYADAMKKCNLASIIKVPSFKSLFKEGVKELDFFHAPMIGAKELSSFISNLTKHGRASYEKEEQYISGDGGHHHKRVMADAQVKEHEASMRTMTEEKSVKKSKLGDREYREQRTNTTTSTTYYSSSGDSSAPFSGIQLPAGWPTSIQGNPMHQTLLNINMASPVIPENLPGDLLAKEEEPPSSQEENKEAAPSEPPTMEPHVNNVEPSTHEEEACKPDLITPEEITMTPSKSPKYNLNTKKGVLTKGGVLWSQLPEVQESSVLQDMTKKQIILKEREYEIFTTQITFAATMKVLVEHFYNAKRFSCFATEEGSQVMDNFQKMTVFSNCLKMHIASDELLRALAERWLKQSPMFEELCDIVRDHYRKDEFGYKYYIKNIPSQIAMLNKLKENPEFCKILTELESHEQCRRLPLSSFLSAPMKRVTQLRLMLENLLKEMQREKNFFKESAVKNAEEAFQVVSNLLYESEKERKILDDSEGKILLSTRLVYSKDYKALDTSNQALERQDLLHLIKPRLFKPWQRGEVVLILLSNIVILTKLKKDKKLKVLDHCNRSKAEVTLLRDTNLFRFKSNLRGAGNSRGSKGGKTLEHQTSFRSPGSISQCAGSISKGSDTQSISGQSMGGISRSSNWWNGGGSSASELRAMARKFRLWMTENHVGLPREYHFEAENTEVALCWAGLMPPNLREDSCESEDEPTLVNDKTE